MIYWTLYVKIKNLTYIYIMFAKTTKSKTDGNNMMALFRIQTRHLLRPSNSEQQLILITQIAPHDEDRRNRPIKKI